MVHNNDSKPSVTHYTNFLEDKYKRIHHDFSSFCFICLSKRFHKYSKKSNCPKPDLQADL